ncbi:MAG: chromosome segregation protein SMC [Nitrospirota bacterium]|nr:chromosome segregation protein SMC [Nitrospirota bacterium]
MHLKSLELTGFKSFAEAKIEFPPGMTAVVGPNGSGKSNVVDAILWVLGEQSTKTLRSERMEDVIFNGTEARKPLGMVEVSLVMSGISDQQLQGIPGLPAQMGELHEVMVTRRLYRNGDSEYLINKILCRLKDVRSLFLDTRAGSKGHTVIEQGRIEQILNASPQDRRELIEETAGIVRYKKQKAEALRKLESTHQSLLRVRDIIAEVHRQLGSLERQARQARAFQNLQQEATGLEVRLLVWDYRSRLACQTVCEGDLAEMEAKESGHAAEQARLQAELETLRLRITEVDQSIARTREDMERLERLKSQAMTAAEVERVKLGQCEQQQMQAEADLARLRHEQEQAGVALEGLRAKLADLDQAVAASAQALTALEAAGAELSTRRAAAVDEEERARRASLDLMMHITREENGLAALQRRLDDARRRADRLSQERTAVEAQWHSAKAQCEAAAHRRGQSEETVQARQCERQTAVGELERIEQALREAERSIGRYQEDAAAVRSRLRALQAVVREGMGYGREGEEATSLRVACQGLREAVAEWLVVPSGLERAVEAVLGERVRGWLVDAPGAARDAVALLKQKGMGRGAFVPSAPRWHREADAAASDWWASLRTKPGVRGLAKDLLHTRGASGEVLACLFDAVVIVESLDVAVGLWELGLWSAPAGPTLVTLEGDVLDPAGILTGGLAEETGGLLQWRREIEELEARSRDLSTKLDETRAARERCETDRQACQATGERLQAAIREAELVVLAAQKDEAIYSRTMSELMHRLDTLSTERQAEEQEQGMVETELQAGRARLVQLGEQKSLHEAGLEERSHARRRLDEESQAFQQRMLEARLAAAANRSQYGHCETDVARLTGEDRERGVRMAALEQQVTALQEAWQRSQDLRRQQEAQCQEYEAQVARIRQDLMRVQEAHAQDVERARAVEGSLDAVRAALTESREARTTLEVRRAELKTQLAALEGTLSGTYQLSVEAALAQEPPPEPALALDGQEPAQDADAVAAQELREKLQKIRDRLDRMGPINLAAIEEHRELEERHKFLTAQEEDLAQSIGALKEIIARINRTTKQMFLETFNELQQKFGEVFTRFFPGGRAELVLVEPEAGEEGEAGARSEPGVDIVAQPPGKRLKSITMLSGGEKTLTAMALIFASFLIRPTPFCILDEIDAPLDEENIGRFAGVLRELAEAAQFLVITHNKRTMAVADSLFGVTMEEPGVSKLVSVRLADLQPA